MGPLFEQAGFPPGVLQVLTGMSSIFLLLKLRAYEGLKQKQLHQQCPALRCILLQASTFNSGPFRRKLVADLLLCSQVTARLEHF